MHGEVEFPGGADIRGPIAARSDITLATMSAIVETGPLPPRLDGLQGYPNPVAVASGNGLTATSGLISGGDALYSDITASFFSSPSMSITNGSFMLVNAPPNHPVDFAGLELAAAAQSARLAGLPCTGTTHRKNHRLFLVGGGADINVFQLAANDLQGVNRVTELILTIPRTCECANSTCMQAGVDDAPWDQLVANDRCIDRCHCAAPTVIINVLFNERDDVTLTQAEHTQAMSDIRTCASVSQSPSYAYSPATEVQLGWFGLNGDFELATEAGGERLDVVWNVPFATNVTLQDAGLPGTVLAPCGDVRLLHGQVRGQVVARSVATPGGGIGVHHVTPRGCSTLAQVALLAVYWASGDANCTAGQLAVDMHALENATLALLGAGPIADVDLNQTLYDAAASMGPWASNCTLRTILLSVQAKLLAVIPSSGPVSTLQLAIAHRAFSAVPAVAGAPGALVPSVSLATLVQGPPGTSPAGTTCSEYCNGAGICSPLGEQACLCNDEDVYAGERCELRICGPRAEPVTHALSAALFGGFVQAPSGRVYACQCQLGYTGRRCTLRVDCPSSSHVTADNVCAGSLASTSPVYDPQLVSPVTNATLFIPAFAMDAALQDDEQPSVLTTPGTGDTTPDFISSSAGDTTDTASATSYSTLIIVVGIVVGMALLAGGVVAWRSRRAAQARAGASPGAPPSPAAQTPGFESAERGSFASPAHAAGGR